MREDRPSETALRIAALHAVARDDADLRDLMPDVDEPYSARFVQACGPGARFRLSLWRWPPLRRLAMRLGDSRAPGAPLTLILRRRYIRETLTRMLEEEPPRQVVVIGAGFDPLCLLLAPRFPQVQFLEVDHPATQRPKAAALAEDELPENLTLLPADLSRDPLEAILRFSPRFEAGAPTLWLAEGLLMYLPPHEVDTLFRTLHGLGAPGSTFVFTVIDRAVVDDPEGSIHAWTDVLRAVGEPLRSSLHRQEISGYLRREGFRLETIADHLVLRDRYLLPRGLKRPLLDAELIVVARAVHQEVAEPAG